MLNPYSRYTEAQLRHLHVDLDQADSPLIDLTPSSELETHFYGKFRNVLRTIYSSDNPVSLCNDIVFSISENAPDDVREFVRSWLLKSVPAIKAAPNDDAAFDALMPARFESHSQLVRYIDHLQNMVNTAAYASKTE